MATNFVQEGNVVQIAQASVSSGDHVVQGQLVGVSLIDTDSDGNIQLATNGVFNLSVTANDGSSDTPISVGDKIFDDSGTLNVNSSGTFFGLALEAVASGETASIPVMIVQG